MSSFAVSSSLDDIGGGVRKSPSSELLLAEGQRISSRLDTLDDRREHWRLLSKLSDRERFSFVRRWAKRAPLAMGRGGIRVASLGGVYTTSMAYNDLCALAIQFGVPLDACLLDLVETVRKKR